MELVMRPHMLHGPDAQSVTCVGVFSIKNYTIDQVVNISDPDLWPVIHTA